MPGASRSLSICCPLGLGLPITSTTMRMKPSTFLMVRFVAGSRTGFLHAKPGEVVHLTRGIPHGFKVVSPEGARLLIVSNGGFEAMLLAASQVASSVSLPEQQQDPTSEMQAKLAEICSANGIQLLGPPID